MPRDEAKKFFKNLKIDRIGTFCFSVIMFLQYYLNEQGERVYTLKKLDPLGQQTCSAHPARFSPDDKYSRHRITIKKRFKVLMTQQPRPVLWGCLNISCVFCCLPAPKRLSAARLFSLWAWKFAPTLAPRIRSHLCLWLCLLWSSHGSIPVQGETFESFRTLNHCQVIKMISKSCYFVCCGKKGVV